MPRLNEEIRTIHAICHHFAHRPDFGLDCQSLVQAVRSQLPWVEVLHGTARCSGMSPEPCSWVRVSGKDYDVQTIARRRRARVSSVFTGDPSWPRDRTLSHTRTVDTDLDSDEPCEHARALEDWSLPSCASCCGKKRAHTYDDGCVSPWKAQTLMGRSLEQAHATRVVMEAYQKHLEGEAQRKRVRRA
jgi:hypothetical protein